MMGLSSMALFVDDIPFSSEVVETWFGSNLNSQSVTEVRLYLIFRNHYVVCVSNNIFEQQGSLLRS